jgi:hypothetical protein
MPMRHGESAGAFSVAARLGSDRVLVAVGGDYRHPDETIGNCAISVDGGVHWKRCEEPPGGYRSAVAYDAASKAWWAVGPNGTDVSTDNGRHWKSRKPSENEAADADKDWNALSLPFVVGPHGRIGKLSP